VNSSRLRRWAYLPFVALAALALIWGYNWVVMKVGVRYSDPFTFSALRNFLGALALFVCVAVRGGSLRPPHPLWLTVIFGIFQTSLSGLGVWALYLGSAGKTSVLTYTMPFWLLLIAWVVLRERLQGTQWIAVGIALAGLILVLKPWELRGLTAGLLAVAGGLCWAIAAVLFKVIRKWHTVELLSFTAWQALIGSIPLILAAVFTATQAPVWSGSFIAALIYNVFVASAVAWLLWLYVLHRLPAGTAGISSLAIPVVGVIAAWIQLGEQPGPAEGIGIALIAAALAILTVRGLRAQRAAIRAKPRAGVEAEALAEAEPGASEPQP
jgi:drug/metabolite transporter (DMT)-like permease